MKPWVKVAIGVGAAAVLWLVVSSYLGHVAAQAEMRATLKQQGELIAAAVKRIEQADQRIEERENAWRRREEDFAAALRASRTPQQISLKMPEFVPGISQPKIEPDPEKPGEERVCISEADYRKLFEVSVTKVKLEEEVVKLESDLQDRRTQISEKDTQIAALEKQRDSAVRAARGGGFWKRLGTAGKWTGIGILIGGAAVAAMSN